MRIEAPTTPYGDGNHRAVCRTARRRRDDPGEGYLRTRCIEELSVDLGPTTEQRQQMRQFAFKVAVLARGQDSLQPLRGVGSANAGTPFAAPQSRGTDGPEPRLGHWLSGR